MHPDPSVPSMSPFTYGTERGPFLFRTYPQPRPFLAGVPKSQDKTIAGGSIERTVLSLAHSRLESNLSDDTTPAPENDSNKWLRNFVEGGLPQIVAGPAGKAISRLIGAGVEIPAAYLDGIAQGIRDKTDARSALSQAIAEHAKQQVVGDPGVMERAMNSMLSRSYRAQVNKDSVAEMAIEDLNENPPNADSEGPSDDWMDKFERHAEEAGSVNLQFLFGKILAGEIRKPGTIGLSTLHFVSMLDGATASLIDKILPYTLPKGVTLLDALPTKLTVAEISFVEQSGFFSANKRYNPKLKEDGKMVEALGNGEFLILAGTKGSEVSMGSAGVLSIAGKGLLQALKPMFETKSYCDQAIKSPYVKRVFYGKGIQNENNFQIPQPTVVENPSFVEN